MRLLNTATLRLESFQAQTPRYAILSHRWTEDELLFEHVIQDGWDDALHTSGASKVKKACQKASEDGLDYIWVDTCCINKSSSAELSEAINSMFLWYHEAVVCYAYLADVSQTESAMEELEQSLWFTRGWTLQELIAPEVLVFYDSDWTKLGTRNELANLISKISRIHEEVLAREQPIAANAEELMQWQRHHRRDFRLRSILSSYSVAARLSWAAGRVTTRVEDIAYSLLGLFDVNMPLLYGEGEKAFQRLLQEIIKSTGDPSVLVSWGVGAPLRQDPSHYKHSGDVRWLEVQGRASSTVSLLNPRTLSIEALIAPCILQSGEYSSRDEKLVIAVIDCILEDSRSRIGIVLRRRGYRDVYEQHSEFPFLVSKPLGEDIVHGLTPETADTKVSFQASELQPSSLQVAMTEAYPITRRKTDLSCAPLVQPPTLHYQIRESQIFPDESQEVNSDINVFIIEDEFSRGFYLIWGYEPAGDHDTPDHRGGSEASELEKPWCRILPWKWNTRNGPRGKVSITGEPDLLVVNLDPLVLFSARETFTAMMSRFRARRSDGRFVDLGDIRVKVTFRPDTFLDIMRFCLMVEITSARDSLPRPLHISDAAVLERRDRWWEKLRFLRRGKGSLDLRSDEGGDAN